MIRNIVFDLGGVLVRWDPINLYRKIFNKESEAKEFLENVCSYQWNLEQDRGRTLLEATEEKVLQFPEYEKEIRAYYDRWDEMLDGTIEENVNILKQYLASEKHKVYALTNWSRETFPIAQKIFPFFSEFDGAVVSGEEGVIKPDPDIYQLLLDRYNLIPEECVFIDDRIENINTAKAMKFKGIHYHSPILSLSKELDRITS